MGRGVNYLSNYSKITYFPFECNDPEDASWEWNDLLDNIKYQLSKVFPSLREANDWEDREVHIILRNRLVEIGISEYCGLVSFSIRPVSDDYQDISGLADKWISQIWDKVDRVLQEKCGMQLYSKVATASNGESFYEERKIA